jgi:glycosyltransferase involved in cell wall biosynthesis
MVEALSDRIDFRIFTSDRDFGDPGPYAGVALNTWIAADRHQRFYADARHRGVRAVAAMIRQVSPRVIYLNSLFDASFSLMPLLLRRLRATPSDAAWIVAPRGECSAGAIALKRFKKRAFLAAARAIGLHRGVTWQASSEHEAADIRRVMGSAADQIAVAPNLTQAVDAFIPPESNDIALPPLRVCFLSRITPKKNLAFAIRVLQRAHIPIEFHIFGPVEDEAYATSCQAMISASGSHLAVTWHGQISPAAVRETFARHHLFLFPTGGENFGHVVFESLAAGVPVLISDQTPWRDLDQAGVGWVRPLTDPQAFTDVINAFGRSTQDDRRSMSQRAYGYTRAMTQSSTTIDANRALFETAMAAVQG